MPVAPSDAVFAFGEYELDTRRRELRRAREPLHVEPQVFDVLAHLFACRDRVVPKEELLDAVWGHRYVAPTTLNSRIKHARQAVGDDGSTQRVIRTVHGTGFRVVADVEVRAPGAPAAGRLEQHVRLCTSVDGVRLAWATSGTGPPLVKPANWLTHLDFDWESPVWRHWLHALSRDHTLVRYDQRGFGLSDHEVADYGFDAWVRDLETVVDAAGLERFPLVALSQGCAIAVAYAARHPERVSRLVLYGGFAQGVMVRARTDAEREEAELLMRQLPAGWGRDNPAFRMFFAARFLPEGTPEQQQWFSELQRRTTTPEIAVKLRTAAGLIDVTEIAPQVRAPTLVLHATGDAVAPFEQGRLLASLVPDARFVSLEGRNHVLLEHEPAWARFVDEVQRFLAEDAPPRAALVRPARPAPRPRSAPAPRPRSG